jgi:hypothetical protein
VAFDPSATTQAAPRYSYCRLTDACFMPPRSNRNKGCSSFNQPTSNGRSHNDVARLLVFRNLCSSVCGLPDISLFTLRGTGEEVSWSAVCPKFHFQMRHLINGLPLPATQLPETTQVKHAEACVLVSWPKLLESPLA